MTRMLASSATAAAAVEWHEDLPEPNATDAAEIHIYRYDPGSGDSGDGNWTEIANHYLGIDYLIPRVEICAMGDSVWVVWQQTHFELYEAQVYQIDTSQLRAAHIPDAATRSTSLDVSGIKLGGPTDFLYEDKLADDDGYAEMLDCQVKMEWDEEIPSNVGGYPRIVYKKYDDPNENVEVWSAQIELNASKNPTGTLIDEQQIGSSQFTKPVFAVNEYDKTRYGSPASTGIRAWSVFQPLGTSTDRDISNLTIVSSSDVWSSPASFDDDVLSMPSLITRVFGGFRTVFETSTTGLFIDSLHGPLEQADAADDNTPQINIDRVDKEDVYMMSIEGTGYETFDIYHLAP